MQKVISHRPPWIDYAPPPRAAVLSFSRVLGGLLYAVAYLHSRQFMPQVCQGGPHVMAIQCYFAYTCRIDVFLSSVRDFILNRTIRKIKGLSHTAYLLRRSFLSNIQYLIPSKVQNWVDDNAVKDIRMNFFLTPSLWKPRSGRDYDTIVGSCN